MDGFNSFKRSTIYRLIGGILFRKTRPMLGRASLVTFLKLCVFFCAVSQKLIEVYRQGKSVVTRFDE